MEVLDVEGVDPPPPTAYDAGKARSAMKENETGLAFVRQQEICEDDWEEKVNKAGKTPISPRILYRTRPWIFL